MSLSCLTSPLTQTSVPLTVPSILTRGHGDQEGDSDLQMGSLKALPSSSSLVLRYVTRSPSMAKPMGKEPPRKASAKPNWVFQLTMKIDETVLTAETSLELGQKGEEGLGKVGNPPMFF